MKNKSLRFIKISITVLITAALCMILSSDIKRRNITDADFMYAVANGERIKIFDSKDGYYLFLPGYADEENIRLSAEAKKHDIKIERSANIATIFINTSSGSLENIYKDKEYKEPGTIKVIDESGHTVLTSGLTYLKGRGNYSWANWDKKPFSFKLKKDISILGLGAGSTYSLLANASDPTLIRNEVARNIEKAVGIPYAAAGVFADLYINGEYMGNYYLCANIDIGSERINIHNIEEKKSMLFAGSRIEAMDVYETPKMKGWNVPEHIADITGGYLLQREFIDRYLLEYGKMKSGFVTQNDEHFIVESPKYCSVSEINYISGFVNEAEKALLNDNGINPDTGKSYTEYINIRSFADRYLVEETIKNYDGGVSSAYYFKNSDLSDGLLYSGPGWDFDMSLGNYLDWMEYSKEGPEGMTNLSVSGYASVWYPALLKKKEYTDIVKNDYNEYVQAYLTMLEADIIDEYENLLCASAKMDSIRWKDMYDKFGYTTGDHAAYGSLKDFIAKRRAFLDMEWSN